MGNVFSAWGRKGELNEREIDEGETEIRRLEQGRPSSKEGGKEEKENIAKSGGKEAVRAWQIQVPLGSNFKRKHDSNLWLVHVDRFQISA